MKLSTLSIALGCIVAIPQVFGLANPKSFAATVRKFPRNTALGWALMLAATAWFILYVNQESDADFASMKPKLLVAFAAIGVGTCIFIQDFLAVRGLAILLMLLAKLMLDTGRPYLGETPWVLVNQVWAYALIIAGIWFTISPHRARDLIEWGTATEGRIKLTCAVRLAFGLFVAMLGFTVFH